MAPTVDCDELLSLDEAMRQLAEADPLSERVVELRFYAGCTNREAAAFLGVSPRIADMLWAFARAWLRSRLEDIPGGD